VGWQACYRQSPRGVPFLLSSGDPHAALMQTIGPLAVRVKLLSPSDSLGRAAEAVRMSTVGAAPVLADGRLVGLVTSAILGEALTYLGPEEARRARVADLPLARAVVLPESISPADALGFFEANELEQAPVVDSGYGLVGLISKAELAAAICRRVKPALVGGMATPFGVYLTGGGARGGVGDFALMTTGIYIGLLQLLASLAADQISERLFGEQGWIHALQAALPGLYSMRPGPTQASGIVFGLLFALLFRLSWITGYHAAEHQVVHTMEMGEDLVPEVVARKPRVHPRCGTNLVAGAILLEGLCVTAGFDPVVGLVVTFFLWRRVGGVLQQYVTTRPATVEQLWSGIAAAQQLMERYQESPPQHVGVLRRVWNMGLAQVLAGFTVVWGSYLLVAWLLPGQPLGAPDFRLW
jgi:hypothetical protein